MFHEMPCGNNCPVDCPIRPKMMAFQQTLIPPPNNRAAELVRTFFTTYQYLCRSTAKFPSPSIAIPALFDLVVSAKYAERVTNGGWTYCDSHDEAPALFFPFLKTCPRCSVKHNDRPLVASNKPGSDAIGEIAGEITVLILAEMLHRTASHVRLVRSTDRQGDVDMVIYDNTIMALVEIKSSPLAVYPLSWSLRAALTETRNGLVGPKASHTPASIPDLSDGNISLYLPHIDLHINLGSYGSEGWIYDALIRFVEKPENTIRLIEAWQQLYDVYRTRGETSRRDPDSRRWLTCGCGGGVDDSKNAPGLDRTDDIKKGTYQVLKLGAYFKDKCPRGMLRAALVSNFMPAHSYERYLAEIQDIRWTLSKYALNANHPDSLNTFLFRADISTTFMML